MVPLMGEMWRKEKIEMRLIWLSLSLSLSIFLSSASEVRFPRFRGSSYLALPTLKDSEKSMQLNIEFRPEQYEGLILYSGEKQTLEGDFVALLLNQGFVEFRYVCLFLSSSSLPIWHLTLLLPDSLLPLFPMYPMYSMYCIVFVCKCVCVAYPLIDLPHWWLPPEKQWCLKARTKSQRKNWLSLSPFLLTGNWC